MTLDRSGKHTVAHLPVERGSRTLNAARASNRELEIDLRNAMILNFHSPPHFLEVIQKVNFKNWTTKQVAFSRKGHRSNELVQRTLG